jgi:hypothetical protein
MFQKKLKIDYEHRVFKINGKTTYYTWLNIFFLDPGKKRLVAIALDDPALKL